MIDARNLHGAKVLFPNQEWAEVPLFGAGPDSNSSCSLAIVYGKNGAGKSTIANALDGLGNTKTIELLDKQNNAIQPTLDKNKNIFVFNEHYVADNFRKISDSTSLKSIVIFGGDVSNEDDIAKIDTEIKRLEKAEQKQYTKHRKATDAKNKAYQLMKGKLQKEAGWQDRTAYIPGAKPVRQLRESRLLEILKAKDSKSLPLQKLVDDFNYKLQKLTDLSKHGKDSWKPEKLPYFFDKEDVEHVLLQVREGNSTENFSTINEKYLNEAEMPISDLEKLLDEVFSDSATVCPTCFQELEKDYKQRMKSATEGLVSAVRGDAVGEKARGLKCDENDFETSLPLLANIDEKTLAEVSSLDSDINKEISRINNLLSSKYEQPSKVFDVGEWVLGKLSHKFDLLQEKIARSVEQHNLQFLEVSRLRSEVEHLNDKLGAEECWTEACEYVKEAWREQKAHEKLQTTKRNLFSNRNIRDDYMANRNHETIAIGLVNDYLSIVFGEKRFILERNPEGVGYIVTSSGEPVPPWFLSTGEQNILALSYFLVEIAENNEEKDINRLNQLIVLDDPISSFDGDNKYGVLALLSHVMRERVIDGDSSKMVILTHDISVAHDLSKVAESLTSGNCSQFEFYKGRIDKKSFSEIDVYFDILNRMYSVACDGASHDSVAGNESRRLLEAFAHFELGMTLTDVTSSPQVRERIEQDHPGAISFLDQLAIRPLINQDSHSRMQIQQLRFNLLPVVEDWNSIRMIRDILGFIHLVSPMHIPMRLNSTSRRQKEIHENLDKLVFSSSNSSHG